MQRGDVKRRKTTTKARTNAILSLTQSRRGKLVVFIVLFAVIGTAFYFVTKAATPTASVTPASSTVTGPATVVQDSNAYGGSYVQFNAKQTGGGGGNPTGKFYIVNSDIIAPDGSIYYPIGANVGMDLENFTWDGKANGHVADVEAWGWNTVRLTLYCTNTESYSNIAREGYPAFMNRVDAFVQEYTSRKIVVMIECHELTGAIKTGGNYGDKLNQTDKFITDIATKYKNNTYVWINALNEPVWSDNNAWVDIQKHYLNLVRATGAENIVVADNMNTGNDASWDGAKKVYDPSMGQAVRAANPCNVLFSLHAYGGAAENPGTQAYFNNVKAAKLALIIGEIGYTVDGTTTAGSYAQNVRGFNEAMQYAPAMGIGMLWWHATHGQYGVDPYWLKNGTSKTYLNKTGAFYEGGNSANLSPAGQQFWNLSHNKPNLGMFTGSYAASGCSSAAGR